MDAGPPDCSDAAGKAALLGAHANPPVGGLGAAVPAEAGHGVHQVTQKKNIGGEGGVQVAGGVAQAEFGEVSGIFSLSTKDAVFTPAQLKTVEGGRPFRRPR